jgi:hypothetical protein
MHRRPGHKEDRVIRRFFNGTLAMLALTSCVAMAATTKPAATPTPNPKPQGAEVTFVSGIQNDLNARFPTPADAEKAGYFRYTNEDNTGAISYANLQWNSTDPQHPSQLWYSVNGKLLGADFSVPLTPNPPSLWSINPQRWDKFGHPHVHYILVDASGKETYGATSAAKFTAAGGSLADPAAAPLVKMGIAKNAAQVKKVFTFPAEWDLIVWVMQNPDGAFAEKNPLVKPSATAEKDSM